MQAALESVQTGQGTIANPAQEQQVQLWLQALVCGEAEAATEVFGLAQDGGLDLQQIRQLLRQAQQKEAAAPAPAAAGEDGDGGSEAAPAPAAGPPRPTAKAQSARRQLRKMLQPLAAAQIAASEDED
jgi:hypothetical protein